MATAKSTLVLPTPVKIGIALVCIAALAGVGYWVYKKISKLGENKEERQETNAAKQELQALSSQGIQPTFSEAEAKSKCNALIVAANDCDPVGTGATQIMAVVYSIQNKADWFLMSSAFGVRTWADCGFGEVNGSITTLFIEELNTTQMKEVRRHLGQFDISI